MAPIATVHTKFGKICRICLKQQDDMSHLFNKNSEKNDNRSLNIVEKLISLAQVKVSEGDSLPNYICQSCEQQVNNCYEFQALILESDHTLRTCLTSLETNTEYKIEISSEDVDLQFIEIPLEQHENDSSQTETVWIPTFNNSKVWKIRNSTQSKSQTESHISESQDKNPKSTIITESSSKHITHSYVDTDSRRTKVQRYFKCYCCEHIFMSEEERKHHMLQHMQKSEQISVDVLIKCQVCDLSFNDEYELKNHIVSHFGGKPKKSVNPVKTTPILSRQETLNDHSYQSTKSNIIYSKVFKYRCTNCSKPFKSKMKLDEHLKSHSDLVYKCKLCSKVFLRSSSLTQHLLYHMRNRKFECDQCDKVFNKKTELRYHKGTHVDSPPTCEICNKTFQNVQSLKIHSKRHEMGDRFTCDNCGKRYFTNSELARHVQTHTGERNFPCTLCDTSFMSKPELTRHLKYHGGDKNWVCNICNKRYFESGHLKVHMKSHTGEKPFVCIICNKGFVTKCKMERHAKIHERIIDIPETENQL